MKAVERLSPDQLNHVFVHLTPHNKTLTNDVCDTCLDSVLLICCGLRIVDTMWVIFAQHGMKTSVHLGHFGGDPATGSTDTPPQPPQRGSKVNIDATSLDLRICTLTRSDWKSKKVCFCECHLLSSQCPFTPARWARCLGFVFRAMPSNATKTQNDAMLSCEALLSSAC